MLHAATNYEWVAEYKFHDVRRWRFDYALPNKKIAIEIDGGLWVSGRHNRASGYIKDMEKFNSASILGWRILKYQSIKDMFDKINEIKEVIK